MKAPALLLVHVHDLLVVVICDGTKEPSVTAAPMFSWGRCPGCL
jgi:hypothetical protein